VDLLSISPASHCDVEVTEPKALGGATATAMLNE